MERQDSWEINMSNYSEKRLSGLIREKGKTYEERYGIEKPKEIREKMIYQLNQEIKDLSKFIYVSEKKTIINGRLIEMKLLEGIQEGYMIQSTNNGEEVYQSMIILNVRFQIQTVRVDQKFITSLHGKIIQNFVIRLTMAFAYATLITQ